MDTRTLAISLLLLSTFTIPTEEKATRRHKRSLHVPPWGVLSFQRDSVERIPTYSAQIDRSAPYTEHAEYGSRSLPLRNAVESIPDVKEATQRLPLRDAVEKRPPPDEAFDLEYDTPETYDLRKNSIPSVIRDSIPSFQIPFSVPKKYTVLQTSLTPQQHTIFSPTIYFKNILGIPHYYSDSSSQQQFYQIPRALYSHNPFLSGHYSHKETLDPPKNEFDFDTHEEGEKRIVCYLEGIAVYRKDPMSFTPENMDPFVCTHVIYAFAAIDPHNFQMIPRDEEYEIVQGGYRSLTGLKRKNPMLKVLISVGGGREEGSHRFSNLISNAVRRRDFIRSAANFIRQYNFDGLDLHWQYPGAEELGGHATDKQHFNLFLEELSEVFKLHNWLLTVSAPASRFRIEDGFDPMQLADTVDFINMQAYDFHRDREPVADHHAPLSYRPHDNDLDIFYNVDYAARYWLKKGLPRSKLVVGIPFFGRTFTLQFSNDTAIGARIKGPGREGYYTQNPGFLSYFEICDMIINEGLTRKMDSAGAPYVVNGDQWIGFDDPESIERKVSYVKRMGLGGIFVWSADLDDFKGICGEKWPLMKALKQNLKGNEPAPLSQLPTKPIGTCVSDGLYSDPRNCANYYICRSGLSYHLSCGSHMMFDPNSGRCDFIEAALCRPGQTIHIPNALKDLDNILRRENLIADDKSPKVVCYVTNWAFYRKGEGKFVPEHLDQRLCTHIVYAFASLDPEKLLMKEFDPWADLDNNLYERVTTLRDTKVMLALGGWTDSAGDKYSRLVSDGSARRKFVAGAVSFLRRHRFRGLHIDWNYPICWQSNCKKGPASDKPNFTKLLQELKREFDKESPPLSLAVGISGYKEVIDAAYELSAIGRIVDFMSVMTYDYHGSWERRTGHVSPLYERPGDAYMQYNSNFTMEYLVANGAPREKLLMGVPFYGQTFTLAKRDGKYDQGTPASSAGEAGEYTRQPGMLSYYEVCSRIRNHRWIVNRDSYQATGPYAYYGDQWVGYEDVESIREKANYIKKRGFGGAVAWTVDLDDFLNKCCQEPFPLLRSLNRGLGLLSDKGPTRGDCTKPPAPVTPPPPTMTTGFDTGAQGTSSTTPHWGHHTTKPTKKPSSTASTPWWASSTQSTMSSSWWESTRPSTTTTTKKPTSTPWWVPSTPKPTTTTRRPAFTTTRKPSTTTPAEVTTIPPPAVIMPEVDHDPPQKCETGQYAHDPYNCNAYYRCVLGEMKKQYCAGGLHWNRHSKICDWPAVAKCKEQKPGEKPSTSSQLSTASKLTTSMWSTPFSKYTQSSTTERLVTTKEPTVEDAYEHCNSGEYYPHEQCNNFYVCVNGHLVQQSCGPNLYWNSQSGICDWSYKVKCLGKKEAAQQTEKLVKEHDKAHQPNTPCHAGSFSPYAGDCTQYLLCLWDKFQVFQCSPGLHWNKDKKICDWPDHAQCTEGEGETPPSGDEEKETEPTTPRPTRPPHHTTSSAEWSSAKPSTTTTTTLPTPAEPFEPLSDYFKIVCYFTNWAWYRKGIGKYVPEDIDPELCTHIVYGFAVLDYENLIVKAHDSWADFDNHFYERVVAYKKKGLKVSLALGGWNDSMGDKYSRLVNNPAARARFIKHVMEFLEKYDFDGLDLDWEYPKCWQVDCKKGPDSDKPAFAAFVKEIKEAFRPKDYLLSAAVSPSKTVIDAGYDVPAMAENLDWVAVMTYDFHGQWDKQTGHVAPLYLHPEDEVAFFNANFSINYWISEGVPRRKIVMGMPLYGQSFQLENTKNNGLNAKAPGPGQAGEFTRAAGFLAYYEICDRVKNKGWTVMQDPKRRMGPYAYKGNQWVSFDDKEMIRLKSEYIRKMDLGGGMIWALDLDDFKNRCGEGNHPLLSTIRRVLAAPGTGMVKPSVAEAEPEEPTPPPSVDVSTVTMPPSHTTSEPAPPIVDKDSPFKVVCYFTNWAWYRQGVGKYLPGDIDPDLCTHIVYGFAVLNGDQLVIKPHDTWADFDNRFYEKLTAYKEKGIKVLVAIGGWNDSAGDKYSRLVNNPSARRRFIIHVMDFIEKNNFDGLDLDWEYPKCWQVDCTKGPESDKPAFAEFVRELHEAFRPKGWLLSAAVSPSRKVVDAGYDVPALSRYLDWIAVMCYDYHGQWDKVTGHVAPMYAHPEDEDVTFNTNFTIHYWIDQGADRKKIVMGMPMYGQSFSLADNLDNGLNAPTYGGGEAGEETRARGFLAYYEVCSNIIKKGWTVVRDKKGRIGPYAYLRDQWVSFDDIAMIQHKSEYIKQMGLGGGMIWALDLDDFKNLCGCENYPLLRTINRVLRNYAKPAPKCQLGTEKPHITTKRPKPTTSRPQQTWQTQKPPHTWQTQKPTTKLPSETLPCSGRLFEPHKDNCNQYYLCNQGQLILQSCSAGLFWNEDHCDWPENSKCHPDGTTTSPTSAATDTPEPPYVPEAPPTIETTPKPSRPGTTIEPIGDTGYKVVCYFTNWAWYRQGIGKYLPSDIDPSLCTHITYGFAVLDATSLTIKPHDSWADIDNDFYKKVVSYKSYGIKVLIALGGWNDSLGNKYSRLVNDPQARARFVTHIAQFIEKWGFDGLDLDWEYPKCWQVDCNKGPESDKQGFAALVAELSAEFQPRGWLLSAAVSPSKTVIDAGYDVPSLNQHFDWIAVMTYDFHGHWDKETGHVAPLHYYPGDKYDYFNANFSINYWIEMGASPQKLVMGMPLYGQSFSLADASNRGLNEKSYGPGEAGDYTRAGGFLAFYEICERVKRRSWSVTRDPEGRIGPYAVNGNQWVSYDDIAEIRRKSKFVKSMGLGGGMIWALDLDDFRNTCGCGKHPLLKTMNNELRGVPLETNLENCT